MIYIILINEQSFTKSHSKQLIESNSQCYKTDIFFPEVPLCLASDDMSDSFKQLCHICCHVNGRSSSFRTVSSHFFLQTSDTVFDWSLEVYIASIRGIANVPIASRINRKKSINIEKSKLIFHLLLNLDLRKTNSFPEKVSLL